MASAYGGFGVFGTPGPAQQPMTMSNNAQGTPFVPSYFASSKPAPSAAQSTQFLPNTQSSFDQWNSMAHAASTAEQPATQQPVMCSIYDLPTRSPLGGGAQSVPQGTPMSLTSPTPKTAGSPFQAQRPQSTDHSNFHHAYPNTVTVFGFMTVHAESILRHFHSVGRIENYWHVGNGNWMCIKYSREQDAYQALSRHGCIILDETMIGVVITTPEHTRVRDENSLASRLSPQRSPLAQKVTNQALNNYASSASGFPAANRDSMFSPVQKRMPDQLANPFGPSETPLRATPMGMASSQQLPMATMRDRRSADSKVASSGVYNFIENIFGWG